MQSAFDFLDEGEGSSPSRKPAVLTEWPPAASSLASGWLKLWHQFETSLVGQQLLQQIKTRLSAGARIFPPEPLRVFNLLSLNQVRVVILGQDPYHGAGQAQGLAFSVPHGVKVPPSLRNIFKEIHRDGLGTLAVDGNLDRWTRQGVLLLNTVLTVEEGAAASHAQWGWESFTDSVISAVAQLDRPVVFMLWGAHAQSKQALIAQADPVGRHLVLLANHPSPLSALRPPLPFIGCGHFGAANAFLKKNAEQGISW
jgi:uracil-DNA glycosylase